MSVEASLRKAEKLQKSGEIQQAMGLLEEVLTRFPKNKRAAKGLSTLKAQVYEPSPQKRAAIEQAFQSGDYAAVAERCRQLTGRFPESGFVWRYFGLAALRTRQADQALAALAQAASLSPRSGAVQCDLGDAYRALGQPDRAIEMYSAGLALKPDHVIGWNNLAGIFKGLGRMAEAVAALEKAATLVPENAQVHYNLANACQGAGRLLDAACHYTRATELSPGLTAAHFNLGLVRRLLGDLPAAIASFETVLRLDPGHDQARIEKLHQQAHICDFRWADEFANVPADFGMKGIGAAPFAFLAMEDAPCRQRERAALYAARFGTPEPWSPPLRPRAPAGRVRIGYFSADFHDHATMHLMNGLFDHHDRARFEICVYSFGPPKDDAARTGLIKRVDRFHELYGAADDQIRAAALADQLDIAVDLKGYTGDHRAGIFTRRLAPVQMAFLGYPGTLASPAYDYAIADRVVIPDDLRAGFSEKIVFLPGSYQINDDTRVIADPAPTRAQCGLPKTGFVFCCFNNTYKITPQVFDIWMRLLTGTQGSVLWLLRTSAWAETNLRAAAKMRGVDPDRLIFADRLPANQHLARQACADLFLDTFPCNAHTTASDALWGGLPVLTCEGAQFAARVASSLLQAVDLPDLIADTPQTYEATALDLAQNPSKLGALRTWLVENRRQTPLFDTGAYVRHLEAAYIAGFERHWAGMPPLDLQITD